MFKSGESQDSDKPNKAPQIIQKLLFEIMVELKLQWNTMHLAKKSETLTTCEKQPYKLLYRSDINKIYEDLDEHITEKDIEVNIEEPDLQSNLDKDPLLADANAIINTCLRANFLKFSTQILKFYDQSIKKKAKPKGRSVLKKEVTEPLSHQQVFYLDFCNHLSSEPKKTKNNLSKIGENNQVLLLNTISNIIKTLKMRVAIHNYLHPDQKIQVIDRLEIKPEMVAALGH